MTFITIDLAKSHLRVDGDDENALITLMTDAAEQSCQTYLNRNVYATQTELDDAVLAGDTEAILINPAIEAAMLLLLGHLHANREDVAVGVSVAQVPQGSRWLLQPYRRSPGL